MKYNILEYCNTVIMKYNINNNNNLVSLQNDKQMILELDFA